MRGGDHARRGVGRRRHVRLRALLDLPPLSTAEPRKRARPMWQLLVPPVAGPHGPGPRFPVMEPLNKLVWSGKGGVRPTLGEQNDLVAGDCPNRWFRRGQAIGGGVYSLQRTSVPRQANRAGAQLQSHRGDPLRFGGRPTLMGPQRWQPAKAPSHRLHLGRVWSEVFVSLCLRARQSSGRCLRENYPGRRRLIPTIPPVPGGASASPLRR